MNILLWGIAGLCAVFSASVLVVLVRATREGRAVREGRAAREGRTAHEGRAGAARGRGAPAPSAYADYIGPVDRSLAPLNRPLRVGVELFAALFGFPGIGWMVSGRMRVGLPLMVLVPALLWMVYPLYISSAGVVLDQPLSFLFVLPLLSLASAGALAIAEYAPGHARASAPGAAGRGAARPAAPTHPAEGPSR